MLPGRESEGAPAPAQAPPAPVPVPAPARPVAGQARLASTGAEGGSFVRTASMPAPGSLPAWPPAPVDWGLSEVLHEDGETHVLSSLNVTLSTRFKQKEKARNLGAKRDPVRPPWHSADAL